MEPIWCIGTSLLLGNLTEEDNLVYELKNRRSKTIWYVAPEFKIQREEEGSKDTKHWKKVPAKFSKGWSLSKLIRESNF